MQTKDTTVKDGDLFRVLQAIKANTDAQLEALEQIRQEIVRSHEIQTRVARRAVGRMG